MAVTSPSMAGRLRTAMAYLCATVPGAASMDPAEAALAAIPLSGGITNHNFRVTLGSKHYFLRLTGRNTEKLGIARSREAICHDLASQRGLAPRVTARLPEGEGFLSTWIEGSHMSAANLALADPLRRMGHLLRTCHEGPPFPPAPSPFEATWGYLRGIQDTPGMQPPGLQRAEAILGRLESVLTPPPRLAPCHNDLVPENVMDDGERLWLVDWEYAGQGDPYMDLGILAAYLKLGEEGCADLLDAWGENGDDERALARTLLMAAVSDVRDAFWSFRQAGLSDLTMDFRAYGQGFLDSLLRRADDPAFDRRLALLGG